jgi:hypothetical protein
MEHNKLLFIPTQILNISSLYPPIMDKNYLFLFEKEDKNNKFEIAYKTIEFIKGVYFEFKFNKSRPICEIVFIYQILNENIIQKIDKLSILFTNDEKFYLSMIFEKIKFLKIGTILFKLSLLKFDVLKYFQLIINNGNFEKVIYYEIKSIDFISDFNELKYKNNIEILYFILWDEKRINLKLVDNKNDKTRFILQTENENITDKIESTEIKEINDNFRLKNKSYIQKYENDFKFIENQNEVYDYFSYDLKNKVFNSVLTITINENISNYDNYYLTFENVEKDFIDTYKEHEIVKYFFISNFKKYFLNQFILFENDLLYQSKKRLHYRVSKNNVKNLNLEFYFNIIDTNFDENIYKKILSLIKKK